VAAVSGLVVFLLPSTLSSAEAGHGAARPHGDTRQTPQSEAVALGYAKWMSDVSVSVASGSWTFSSGGVPPSDFTAADYAVPDNPNDVSATGAQIVPTTSILQDQNYDYTLPLTPVYATSTTRTNLGPIGVALDGAVFFNPYEANDTTVATKDNFVLRSGGVTASFLDDCDGHPGPHGQYHYHGLPACLADYASGQSVAAVAPVTSTRGSTTTPVSLGTAAAREPVLLGFAFDGYGIYDNIAMNGQTIPVSKLDACNGTFSAVPGYPQGIYHYVLENLKSKQADIGCYHGVVSPAYTQALEETLNGPSAAASGVPPPSTQSGRGAVAPGGRGLAANADEDAYLREVIAASGNLCG